MSKTSNCACDYNVLLSGFRTYTARHTGQIGRAAARNAVEAAAPAAPPVCSAPGRSHAVSRSSASRQRAWNTWLQLSSASGRAVFAVFGWISCCLSLELDSKGADCFGEGFEARAFELPVSCWLDADAVCRMFDALKFDGLALLIGGSFTELELEWGLSETGIEAVVSKRLCRRIAPKQIGQSASFRSRT